ncbi:MAG TPA: lipase maturation factor family protein [Thermoanaerobaculia bacterium]|nr:lipase maturation factor family protein [Thermoanaerobaculia bacterium]
MEGPRVAQPPERPLAVFDGDCGFCRAWIARWKEAAGPAVDDAPSQEVASRFPEIPPEAFARAFQLVLPDGRVLEGAEAVFATLAFRPKGSRLAWAYRRVPGFAAITEAAYRLIAGHRGAAATATRLLWGRSVARPTYFAASSLFLRLLGICYVAAFVSLWVQVDGLIGSWGILPAGRYLEWIRSQTGAERYALAPTFLWVSSSDAALHLLCAAGAAAGLCLALGFLPAVSAAAGWALYLSFSVVGQIFLEFQWDALLLETGLLAIFLASPRRGRFGAGLATAGIARGLLRWLLFRLMFSSGWVKLASGDAAWRGLTALRYHYETQPLPPWTAWYMHQLPASFQRASAAFLFFVELAVPFFYFAPRRLRVWAAWLTIALQAIIAATGNYAFFNLLTVALAVLLLDDQSLPGRWARAAETDALPARLWPKWVLVPVAAVALFASTVEFGATLDRSLTIPGPILAAFRDLAVLRSFNGYGLFMVMTTERPEIRVEGSEDGETWKAYEFRWKPGPLQRRPEFVAPHQPRLDWQMWFAALGGYGQNPWLRAFLARLLEGSPAVERLLAKNPFPNGPPRYVRAVLDDYRFTDRAERARTGDWWKRRELGPYSPVFERTLER